MQQLLQEKAIGNFRITLYTPFFSLPAYHLKSMSIYNITIKNPKKLSYSVGESLWVCWLTTPNDPNISHQYQKTHLQLHLGLLEPLSVTGVNEEDNGINCLEIVLPHSSHWCAPTNFKGCASHSSYCHIFPCYRVLEIV